MIPRRGQETGAERVVQPAAPPPAPVVPGKGEPILMPHGDLTVTEATVVRWLKQAGAAVKAGEAVVEVETDKAVTEIESPAAGVLGQILAQPNATVKMGETLGFIHPKQTGDNAT